MGRKNITSKQFQAWLAPLVRHSGSCLWCTNRTTIHKAHHSLIGLLQSYCRAAVRFVLCLAMWIVPSTSADSKQAPTRPMFQVAPKILRCWLRASRCQMDSELHLKIERFVRLPFANHYFGLWNTIYWMDS